MFTCECRQSWADLRRCAHKSVWRHNFACIMYANEGQQACTYYCCAYVARPPAQCMALGSFPAIAHVISVQASSRLHILTINQAGPGTWPDHPLNVGVVFPSRCPAVAAALSCHRYELGARPRQRCPGYCKPISDEGTDASLCQLIVAGQWQMQQMYVQSTSWLYGVSTAWTSLSWSTTPEPSVERN